LTLYFPFLFVFLYLSPSVLLYRKTNMSNSSDSSSHSLIYCLKSRPAMATFTTFFATYILLMPLFILVLYVGYQRWRKQPSGSTEMTTSNSDIFTYNVIVLELISLAGCCCYCYAIWTNVQSMMGVGRDLSFFTSSGQSLFHVLTCVERYLAVVHPITYWSLRQAGGVRIRNISIGCVWLLCLMILIVTKVFSRYTIMVMQSCFLVFLILVVSFCSLSVLWVLIRPGPGEGGRDREHADQSKRRAFHTITAIMVALWLRFVGVLAGVLTSNSTHTPTLCAVVSSGAWLTMPGSLVLPLLFLHRAGKLPGLKRVN